MTNIGLIDHLIKTWILWEITFIIFIIKAKKSEISA